MLSGSKKHIGEIPRPKRSTLELAVRGAIGLFLAPLDGLYGLLKGAYYFFTALFSSEKYYSPPAKMQGAIKGDAYARTALPATMALSRITSVLVSAFCILGFIGALAVPLPGVAPLYALSVAAIAKAVGITLGWTILARGIATAIGAATDYNLLIRPIFKAHKNYKHSHDEDAGLSPTTHKKGSDSTATIVHLTTDKYKRKNAHSYKPDIRDFRSDSEESDDEDLGDFLKNNQLGEGHKQKRVKQVALPADETDAHPRDDSAEASIQARQKHARAGYALVTATITLFGETGPDINKAIRAPANNNHDASPSTGLKKVR